MFLITSAGYISPEFTAQFGSIPPALLPLANKRIYEFQIAMAKQVSDDIVLSLPASYQLPDIDRARLNELGARIVEVPDGLSLGASIVYCLNVSMVPDTPLQILHGDTLFDGPLPTSLDCVSVGEAVDFYKWGRVKLNADGYVLAADDGLTRTDAQAVMAGYFNFSRPRSLVAAISRSEFNFVRGIEDYARHHPVTSHPSKGWLDFGHLTAYYKSKALHTTERAFNTLRTSRTTLSKTSVDHSKISAEAGWFEAMPNALHSYTPKYLGQSTAEDGAVTYDLEYLYLSTLSDIYTFGELPTDIWKGIISCCDAFLQTAQSIKPADPAPLQEVFSQAKYSEKLHKRLNQFCDEIGMDRTVPLELCGRALPSLDVIAEEVAQAVPDATEEDIGIWHGDFCFSNVFYDFRSQQIKVVDPRGRDFDGNHTAFGDCRYDIAKMYHSIIGRYDSIIAGRYTLKWDGRHQFDLSVPASEQQRLIEAAVLERSFGSYERRDWVLPMTISLFLSMLPLHYENRDRQMALLANALRLYVLWKGLKHC